MSNPAIPSKKISNPAIPQEYLLNPVSRQNFRYNKINSKGAQRVWVQWCVCVSVLYIYICFVSKIGKNAPKLDLGSFRPNDEIKSHAGGR